MRIVVLGLVGSSLVACGGGSGSDAGQDAPAALDCPTYCAGIAAVCSGEFAQYASTASCMGACAAFPRGTTNDTGGNTLGCRIYHVSEVASMSPDHCDHAGPAGQDECGSDCEGFCTLALAICSSAYSNMSACMTECAMFPDTAELNSTVTTGDSLSCRLQHLTLAAASSAAAISECPNIRMSSPTCM